MSIRSNRVMPNASETLPQVSSQLQAFRSKYVDRIIPVESMRWNRDRLVIAAAGSDFEAEASVSRVAQDQMFELLGVPKVFGRSCPADLRENIINRLLPTVAQSRVFVRLINKNGSDKLEARAILPQNFEPFDFTNLSDVLLRVSEKLGRPFEIDRGQNGPDKGLESWNVRLIDPESGVDIDEPEEKIFMGIDARTSEVGLFNPSIEPVLYQLICTNGLKAPVAGGEASDMLRFRYYHVNTESIVERICAHIEQVSIGYAAKRDMLRNASRARMRGDRAEELYMNTLVGAHAAGGAKHREDLMNRLRSHRSQSGDYSVYRVVSLLTEIARDHSQVETTIPEWNLNRVDSIERGAGQILEQYAGVAA